MKAWILASFFALSSISVNSGINEPRFHPVQHKIERLNLQSKTLDTYSLNTSQYFNKEESDSISNLCNILNIKEEYLYKVMFKECSFNHQAINKKSKAVGLIGFLPSTASYLGTTTEEIYNMTKLQQLQYVYKYLQPICKKYKLSTYKDVYLAIFYPRALGKQDDYVLGKNKSKTVLWNSPFDTNNDGTITVGEFKQKI